MKQLMCGLGLVWLFGGAMPAHAESWTIATRANNIHCEVGDDPRRATLMCNIFRRSGPFAQPKPDKCLHKWGHVYLIVERGPVRMLCLEAWKNNWPGNGKFDRGKPSEFRGIVCSATRNTLACKNLDGHGFELSRKVQKVF
ncbi:hypothetical protein N4R57_13900 [Rhodobacteraceae bacterium D3-12]|nr:hypothetical protein N4R57_13900 [Rhodobacteraceae bacterium D3-12]